jgi:hypothetical protein
VSSSQCSWSIVDVVAVLVDVVVVSVVEIMPMIAVLVDIAAMSVVDVVAVLVEHRGRRSQCPWSIVDVVAMLVGVVVVSVVEIMPMIAMLVGVVVVSVVEIMPISAAGLAVFAGRADAVRHSHMPMICHGHYNITAGWLLLPLRRVKDGRVLLTRPPSAALTEEKSWFFALSSSEDIVAVSS